MAERTAHARRTRAGTLATVGDLIDGGYRMDAWCPKCSRSIRIDLERLAGRYGRTESYIVGETRIRIVCNVCGTKPLAFTIAAR